jgi:O-antigen biosynthesis protein WbqP
MSGAPDADRGRALANAAGTSAHEAVATARAIAPAPRGVYGAVKRAADLLASTLLLALCAPLLAVIAIAIRRDSPGPALFRQRRIGRGSREFVILKFRTMRTGTPDLASHLIQDQVADRITRLGALLRRTSLDELPQLWNVWRGDMSVVGPRPALFNQYDLIELRQRANVDALRPGVTGWAQVNGRDDIPLDRKVALDRHYLEHAGPALDLEILVRTAIVLITGKGVN